MTLRTLDTESESDVLAWRGGGWQLCGHGRDPGPIRRPESTTRRVRAIRAFRLIHHLEKHARARALSFSTLTA